MYVILTSGHYSLMSYNHIVYRDRSGAAALIVILAAKANHTLIFMHSL